MAILLPATARHTVLKLSPWKNVNHGTGASSVLSAGHEENDHYVEDPVWIDMSRSYISESDRSKVDIGIEWRISRPTRVITSAMEERSPLEGVESPWNHWGFEYHGASLRGREASYDRHFRNFHEFQCIWGPKIFKPLNPILGVTTGSPQGKTHPLRCLKRGHGWKAIPQRSHWSVVDPCITHIFHPMYQRGFIPSLTG